MANINKSYKKPVQKSKFASTLKKLQPKMGK